MKNLEVKSSNLKIMRMKKQKTFRELGELLNIGATGYFKKEIGERKFTLKEAKSLADYYNLTIEELFFDNDFS